jgi:cysteinyl-tRNA synthetase
MARDDAPAEIRALADARAAARRAKDWSTADALRDEIEAAGWRVVDAASLYTLERATAPDVVEDGVPRYGSSASVPSRLDDAPVGVASVVLLATDWPEDLARAVDALADHSPDGTQLVIVDNGASDAQVAALETLAAEAPGAPGIGLEVVRTSARLGHASALNAGIRRAEAPVVVLLDTAVEVRGDLVSPLVAALEDPIVAVAGPFGLVSDDLRTYEEPPAGTVDVVAIEGYAQAFRRSDYVGRGPLDEHFAFYRNLDIWWSLVLRDPFAADDEGDEGDDEDEGGARDQDLVVDLASVPAPRRAVVVGGVDVVRHEHRGWTALPEAERDRLSKRNFYRILKRYATRRDLLLGDA